MLLPQPDLAPGGYTDPYALAGADKDCGDFDTWQDTQAFFEAARQRTGQADRHRLDSDSDEIACESLAGAPGR